MHDASDVIAEAENLGRSHRLRIDLVDDRAAVRPVFGNRNPDMATVVVNPAGMVHRALAQRDIGDEVAFRVDLEEVPDALPDIPIVAFSKLQVALRRDLNGQRRRNHHRSSPCPADGRSESSAGLPQLVATRRAGEFHHALDSALQEPDPWQLVGRAKRRSSREAPPRPS